ncbi:thymidine phosphorylase [Urinicoccus massiliensis]|uniref:thymidine phosphorylase n=1 Tax=Urinicoccus massiliensis TaxID=1723382 RepID=UPI000930A2AB|nr:thymidine phosphorylase [Urinicoccus massiliensis]
MHINELIEKKKHGQDLSSEEIHYWIQGYLKGDIKDYQVSALLMAIYFQGLNEKETYDLTNELLHSGDTVDLSSIQGIKVDKHSTGGVGDTTSLVLGPLVAAAGCPFAKMSGRGLGHTGGTLDKLEAIQGLSVDLSVQDFIKQVNEIGLAIAGQTANITPGDKKLYSLRDATQTVDNISLIAASILSKKIAIGSDALILDVKVGDGAFMKTKEEAEKLSTALVKLGKAFNRNVMALITSMEEPLGQAVGNLIEVQEAIRVLMGQGPQDLEDLCLNLGAKVLVLAKKFDQEDQALEALKETIKNGQALNKFNEMIKAQGGQIDAQGLLDQDLSPLLGQVKAQEDGYLASLHALTIGEAARRLGAGRLSMEDVIDPGAGIYLVKKIGQKVTKGETILELYGKDSSEIQEIIQDIQAGITYSKDPVQAPTLILHEVR